MKPVEYFKYAIKNKLLSKLEWIYSMFAKPMSDTKYIKIRKDKYYVVVDGKEIEVTMNKDDAFLSPYDKITLTKEDLVNIVDKVDTTIGRALINYIVFVHPFGNKIPYNNDSMLDLNKIHENKIISRLSNKESENSISIKEYNSFGISLSMVRSLAELFVISSTEKGILPPPNIKEFKQKVIKEFKDKYGPDVFKDRVKVAEFENRLKAYDREWLKDDPSFGISLSGKILNNSRKKRYLAFGAEDGILHKEDAVLVENSLLEGYPKDKEQLATVFNTARAGSYSRGKETQVSGVISDRLVRGTTGFRIKGTDCKTTNTYRLHVTKDNFISLIGRSHLVGSKRILIENDIDAGKLVDTYINLITMLYCKTKGNNYCPVCAGKSISKTKNGFTLIALDLGASAMSANLKKMHDSTLAIYELTIDDLI